MAKTKILDWLAGDGKISEIDDNYKYNLMVYSDLNLGIVANNIDNNKMSQVLADVAKNQFIRKISFVDTHHFGSKTSSRPKGYWLGLEIPFGNDRWGIDCWFQKPRCIENNSDGYVDKLSKLNKPPKDAILKLK